MFLSGLNKKILFYRIPKNASTSIYNHIGNHNIIYERHKEVCSNADQEIYKNWFCPSHGTPNELYRTFGDEMKNCMRFCVVRNPWDRMVSMYNQNRKVKSWSITGQKANTTFKQFCQLIQKNKNNSKFIGSTPQIEWACGKYAAHEILRFENLSEDFSKMINKYNIISIDKNLPHQNKTNHPHFSECYDLESKEMIADVFLEDINKFNYSFPEGSDFSKPKGSQGFLRI